MPEELIKPVHLKFRGLDADQHVMDGAYLGRSIQGTSRLYTSILLFLFEGQIPKRIVSPNIKIMVGPPQDGSLMYLIYAMMTHGQMALYPQILWELADLSLPVFIKAVLARKSGRRDHLDKALDIIAEQSKVQADFMNKIHDGHMSDKQMMFNVIDRLASSNSNALSEMSQPIGRTAKSLTHFDGTKVLESHIDEPMAEALRSEEELKVGDQVVYRGKIVGVDKTNGACRFEPEGQSKDLRGKITDPSLAATGNIYTHSLDTAAVVEVTAKPVFKEDGEIKTLFISDAKEIR